MGEGDKPQGGLPLGRPRARRAGAIPFPTAAQRVRPAQRPAWRSGALRAAARHCGGEGLLETPGDAPGFLWLFGNALMEAHAENDGSVAVRAILLHGLANAASDDEREGRRPLAQAFAIWERDGAPGRLVVDRSGDLTLLARLRPRSATQLPRQLWDWCVYVDRFDDELCSDLGTLSAGQTLLACVEELTATLARRTVVRAL